METPYFPYWSVLQQRLPPLPFPHLLFLKTGYCFDWDWLMIGFSPQVLPRLLVVSLFSSFYAGRFTLVHIQSKIAYLKSKYLWTY